MLPSSIHCEQQQPDSEACTQHPDLNFNSIKRKQGSCRKWPVRDWEQGLRSESRTHQKCRRAQASTGVEAPRRRKLYLPSTGITFSSPRHCRTGSCSCQPDATQSLRLKPGC